MIPISDADYHRRGFPVVNVALIGLNALVFLYEIALGGLGFLLGGGGAAIAVFFLKWGFIPHELSSGELLTLIPYARDAAGRTLFADAASPVPTWATIFSSMFIHGGLMHFGGNMLFLWVFGDNIEDQLGHVKYLLFYLFTGVVATLSHLAIDPGSLTPLVGASGAISGVLGAYLLLFPYNRIKTLVIFIFITALELPALYVLGAWFLLQLINGLGALGLSSQVDVAFFAHVGGFAAGAAIVVGYKLLTRQPVWPPRRQSQQPWDNWHRFRRGPW